MLELAHPPVARRDAQLHARAASSSVAFGALARTVLSTRPLAARAVTRTAGALMIVIGGLLLLERLARQLPLMPLMPLMPRKQHPRPSADTLANYEVQSVLDEFIDCH